MPRETESGQSVEQGDTFFTTNDDVNSIVSTRGVGPFGDVEGKMVFSFNAVFVEGQVTNIVREQDVLDQGDPIGTKNANFVIGTVVAPGPVLCSGDPYSNARRPD